MDIELLAGSPAEGESQKAITACNDWLRLGPGRSIPKLLAYYQTQTEIIKKFEPPSASAKTLGTWSSRFKWPEREALYDANWEERKNAEREQEMGLSLALDYERVRKLKALAGLLEAQIFERDDDGRFINIWLDDVKSVGSGDKAERVDLVRFNSALVDQYRAVLDDLAKETGGRIQRKDMTTAGEKIPIAFVRMDMDEL